MGGLPIFGGKCSKGIVPALSLSCLLSCHEVNGFEFSLPHAPTTMCHHRPKTMEPSMVLKSHGLKPPNLWTKLNLFLI